MCRATAQAFSLRLLTANDRVSVRYGQDNVTVGRVVLQVFLFSLINYRYIIVPYSFITHPVGSGFGGLEVACWPLVHKFAGSNPAEAVGFLRVNKKILSTSGGMDVCLL